MEHDEVDYEDLSYEYCVKHLVESVSEDFDGPIYRNEEDLEMVRNSDSPTVAVLAPDRPAILFVSREKFLRGEIKMNADDLLDHALRP